MRALGIHYRFRARDRRRLQPGQSEHRQNQASYSADIGEVEANALLTSEIARETGIGLCLKHFPGIGGAVVDSHQEFMDISDSLSRRAGRAVLFAGAKNVRRCRARQPRHRRAMGSRQSDDAVAGWPRAVARALARNAPDQRRHADAGIAEGARHQAKPACGR